MKMTEANDLLTAVKELVDFGLEVPAEIRDYPKSFLQVNKKLEEIVTRRLKDDQELRWKIITVLRYEADIIITQARTIRQRDEEIAELKAYSDAPVSPRKPIASAKKKSAPKRNTRAS